MTPIFPRHLPPPIPDPPPVPPPVPLDRAAPLSEHAMRAALIEFLCEVPALPETWPTGTVKKALHKALVKYESLRGSPLP